MSRIRSELVRPPGPRSRFPLENLLRFRRDLPGFLQKAAAYGDIAYFRAGSRDVYLLSRPDLIREVLVTNSHQFVKSLALQMSRRFLGQGLLTSEGALHLRQRRLMQPVFHRQRIAGYAETMSRIADSVASRLPEGVEVDMHHEMMRLTLSIAAKTLFDTDVDSEADEIGRAVTEVMSGFYRVLNPFGPVLNRLPLPSNRRFDRAHERINRIIYRLIAERRSSGKRSRDLLSMLLEATDEEEGGSRMSDQQVRDEAVTLLIAGHETTANALTWTWYLLSENPQVEARLHDELDRVVPGRLPTGEDLPQLVYTRRVFAESMRLFPPAYTIGRESREEVTIGDYRIPPRSTVLMSQYVVHRDPRYFPDPLRFDPDRWTPEVESSRPRLSYFPFGAGPRVCIGESFAWMEGTLVLAVLASRWKARLAPGHPVELWPLLTLRPRHGMKMKLERR